MATNLSREDELRGILSDVARKRFTNSRQVNPVSNLFLTTKYAVENQYILDLLPKFFSNRDHYCPF